MKRLLMAFIPGFLRKKRALFRAYLTLKINGKYTKGFLVQNEDVSLIVGSDDMYVGRVLRKNGAYGRDEFNRISKLTSSDSSVIFIGTHIGALAIPTARKVKSCIFIEANPNTFKFLSMNVTLNNIDNAICHNVAVGEKEGEINFVMSKVNSGGSKREPFVKDNMYYYDNPRTISVPMVTLDSICSDKEKYFDLVFMDIEGSEAFALKGMTSVLSRTRALIVEFIPHHFTNVSNCSVDDFLGLFSENFSYCYVPSKRKYLKSHQFSEFLNTMFKLGESDDGLVFTKESFNFD